MAGQARAKLRHGGSSTVPTSPRTRAATQSRSGRGESITPKSNAPPSLRWALGPRAQCCMQPPTSERCLCLSGIARQQTARRTARVWRSVASARSRGWATRAVRQVTIGRVSGSHIERVVAQFRDREGQLFHARRVTPRDPSGYSRHCTPQISEDDARRRAQRAPRLLAVEDE